MSKQTPLAFEIRDSGIAGRGAFALRSIRAGERLIEYTGERITHREADRRYDDASMTEHHTFLFTVSNRTVIDASHGGNEARYLNHSCEPNCESVIEKGRVFIDAIRDIAPGEELVYDYAYERSGDETEWDEAHYRCRCGSRTCRGSIMEPEESFAERESKRRRRRGDASGSTATRG
jgi:uncharacterized protein